MKVELYVSTTFRPEPYRVECQTLKSARIQGKAIIRRDPTTAAVIVRPDDKIEVL